MPARGIAKGHLKPENTTGLLDKYDEYKVLCCGRASKVRLTELRDVSPLNPEPSSVLKTGVRKLRPKRG